jgi:competence protein ComEC
MVGSTSGLERTVADFRSRIGAALRAAVPGDAGVLLNGLVTGDDTGFSRPREEALLATGTTHLTAVSGANLAMIAGILAAVGAGTVGRHRLSWQLLTIGGVWAYAVISGAQAPAVRAAIVATAAILAFRFGRRPDFPTLVLLAAGAMVLIQPRQIESLGFRLSVAASLALGWVLPGLLRRRQRSPVADVVYATAAAQVATAPLLLLVFGTLSLMSLPANVVAAPLVAIAMPLALLAGLSGVLWPPLGEAVAAPASLVAGVLLSVIDVFAGWGTALKVGTPMVDVGWVLAAVSVAVLLAMSASPNWVAKRLKRGPMEPAPGAERPSEARQEFFPVLPPPASGILTWEHPTDALAAHTDDAEEQPTSEEDRDEVADDRDLP